MGLLFLYWGMVLIGYGLGSKLRHIKNRLRWISTLLFVAIAALVFLMGVRMGSSEEVITNLGTIGLKALFMTIVIVAGSIFAVIGTRKLFRMNKFGELIQPLEEPSPVAKTAPEISTDLLSEDLPEIHKSNGHSVTLLILILISAGLFSGYFFVPKIFSSVESFEHLSSTLLVVGLCGLLFFVGIDLGLSGSVLNNIKSAGFRVIAFPVAVAFGSLFSAYLCSFVLPISAKEAVAIGAGFGWYTLAPIVISEQGYEIAGAISFMHNIIREFGGIALFPFVAGKIGYIEAASMPGVASMDLCIPMVERFCSEKIVIYSFLIGLIQSFLVPFLVPLIIGL